MNIHTRNAVMIGSALLLAATAPLLAQEARSPQPDWATVALLHCDQLPLKDASAKGARADGKGLVLAPGRFGKALDFSQGGSAGFTIPMSAQPTSAVTLECWLFAKQRGKGRLQRIVGRGNNFGLYMGSKTPKIYFFARPRSEDGKLSWRVARARLPMKRWVHVAGVFDGENLSLYMDGKLVGRVRGPGRLIQSGARFHVGLEGSDPKQRFPGLIDEVRVSSIARKDVVLGGAAPPPATPKSVTALDVGPESGSLMPGFKRLSPRTAYTAERGYGWVPWKPQDWRKPAVDSVQPDPLCGDYLMVSGRQTRLRVDAPDGDYHVWFWSGRWGSPRGHLPPAAGFGFACLDRGGALHKTRWDQFLHDNFWQPGTWLESDTDFYNAWMRPWFPRFEGIVKARGGRIMLKPWGRFAVNGLVLCPEKDVEAGRKWLAAVEAKRRELFHYTDVTPPPAPEFQPTAEEKRRGFALFVPQRETALFPTSAPSDTAPRATALTAFACRGETEPVNLSVRPVKDFLRSRVRARMTDLVGPSGARIGGPDIEAFDVQMLPRGRPSRGQRFRYQGYLLRKAGRRYLKRGFTRHYWWNVRIPDRAPAGLYKGHVAIESSDRGGTVELARLPVRVRVLSMDLLSSDETGAKLMTPYTPFAGFSQTGYDWDRVAPSYRGDMRHMRACGLNTGMLWGLRNVASAYLSSGRVPLAALNSVAPYWRVCKQVGFPYVFSYAFQSMTSIAWRTADSNRFAKRLKDSYLGPKHRAALREVVKTVTDFQKQRDLPTLIVSIMDEAICHGGKKSLPAYTRMVQYFAELKKEFGIRHCVLDYSKVVDGFVKGLDICAPNRYGTQENFAKMKAVGAEPWLYNTGMERFQFGYYCWRADLKGLWVWYYCHVRDSQIFPFRSIGVMACQTATGPIPTVNSQWVREGVDDLRYLRTLEAYIRRGLKSGKPAAQAAARAGKKALDELRASMTVNFFHYTMNRAEGGPAPDAWDPCALDALRWKIARHAESIAGALGETR